MPKPTYTATEVLRRKAHTNMAKLDIDSWNRKNRKNSRPAEWGTWVRVKGVSRSWQKSHLQPQHVPASAFHAAFPAACAASRLRLLWACHATPLTVVVLEEQRELQDEAVDGDEVAREEGQRQLPGSPRHPTTPGRAARRFEVTMQHAHVSKYAPFTAQHAVQHTDDSWLLSPHFHTSTLCSTVLTSRLCPSCP